MGTVKIELDDELVALLEASGGGLEETTREMLVIELFRRGTISTGKASGLLGLTRIEFARRASDLGIPYFLISKEDWEAEKAALDAWLPS